MEEMRSTEPTLYLVWDFGSEATQPEYPTLRAVDSTFELAVKHKEYLEQKRIKAMIESISQNHLFAESCLGKLERIEKRETERKARKERMLTSKETFGSLGGS
jgi:squalene cyclase